MKKLLSFLIISLLLSSCTLFESDDLQKAKQNLGVNNGNQVESPVSSDVSKITEDDVLNNNVDEKVNNVDEEVSSKPKFIIEPLTEDQFIELDSIADQIVDVTDSIKISGKTLAHVDKIVVNFSNRDSSFPIDNYTLTTFKAGSNNFLYNAKKEFKVLDFGTNKYVFEAYSGDKISKLQLTVIMPKPVEKGEEHSDMKIPDNLTEGLTYEKKIVGEGDEQAYLSLPKSEIFGDPLNAGENKIIYSNINGLEIKKQEISDSDINLSTITDYLGEKINTWYYWNTPRNIIKDKGISFYVLKLEGDSYTYEKHYIDYIHNLYGIYTIETGIKADKENIAKHIETTNEELKEKNDYLDKVKIVDALFVEIVR